MADSAQTLTPRERRQIHLLFVDADKNEHEVIRAAMRALALGSVTFSVGHFEGLELFNQRRFTHVLFPATPTNMPADEFAERLLNMVPTLILIPTSWQPDADDVFSLLQIGCRGYLCKPFTCESIESALTQATKGEPIAQAILDARDRNEAFAALLAGCVDRLSTLERQSSAFVSASKELGAVRQRLSQASQIARTFARGGEAELRESIVDFLINLSNGPATKLGRLRKRLSTKRQDSVPENVKGDPPTRKPIS